MNWVFIFIVLSFSVHFSFFSPLPSYSCHKINASLFTYFCFYELSLEGSSLFIFAYYNSNYTSFIGIQALEFHKDRNRGCKKSIWKRSEDYSISVTIHLKSKFKSKILHDLWIYKYIVPWCIFNKIIWISGVSNLKHILYAHKS